MPVLLAILLMEGYISVSVEMIIIKQLTPFYGNSLVVTSLIIGFFLLFLAAGYWRGGKRQEAVYRILSLNFGWTLIWIGAGLSTAFLVWYTNLMSNSLSIPWQCALPLYLSVILAPIVYWLGQTLPLTTRLFNQQLKISRISAQALFLSTLGSCLGALITTLLFFRYLGVQWTVFISCLLLFAIVLLLKPHSGLHWGYYVLLLLALYLVKILTVHEDGTLAETWRPVGTAENIQASAAAPYIPKIQRMLFDHLHTQDKKILLIGNGYSQLLSSGFRGNQVSRMGYNAEASLQHDNEHYDVIVSETRVSTAYLQQLAKHLNPGGLLLMGVQANPWLGDDHSKRIYNSFRQVFPFCRPSMLSWQQSNLMLYYCIKHKADKTVYTDDLNRATYDYFPLIRSFRQNPWPSFHPNIVFDYHESD